MSPVDGFFMFRIVLPIVVVSLVFALVATIICCRKRRIENQRRQRQYRRRQQGQSASGGLESDASSGPPFMIQPPPYMEVTANESRYPHPAHALHSVPMATNKPLELPPSYESVIASDVMVTLPVYQRTPPPAAARLRGGDNQVLQNGSGEDCSLPAYVMPPPQRIDNESEAAIDHNNQNTTHASINISITARDIATDSSVHVNSEISTRGATVQSSGASISVVVNPTTESHTSPSTQRDNDGSNDLGITNSAFAED